LIIRIHYTCSVSSSSSTSGQCCRSGSWQIVDKGGNFYNFRSTTAYARSV